MCIDCGKIISNHSFSRCRDCDYKTRIGRNKGKNFFGSGQFKKGRRKFKEENSNWKGGRKTDRGYIFIHSPEHPYNSIGYVQEHRLVVEKYIGRYLNRKEVVHHINSNRQDNRIENLMVFQNNAEHLKFHTKVRQFGITNPIKRQIENRWTLYKNVKILI